jgi:hypothetical protein
LVKRRNKADNTSSRSLSKKDEEKSEFDFHISILNATSNRNVVLKRTRSKAKMTSSKKKYQSCHSNFDFDVVLHLYLLLFFNSCCCCCEAALKTPVLNVTAVTGVSVELKCKVRLQECGNFYSIEWYRENNAGGLDNNVNSNIIEDEHKQFKSKQANESPGRGKRQANSNVRHKRDVQNDGEPYEVSILSTFYEQLLHMQIPKAQKNTVNPTC